MIEPARFLVQAWVEHWSVGACRQQAARAIDLASCLRAFTSCERLEQRYHCSHCRSAQPATKKLQIWKLPPILVGTTDNCSTYATPKQTGVYRKNRMSQITIDIDLIAYAAILRVYTPK